MLIKECISCLLPVRSHAWMQKYGSLLGLDDCFSSPRKEEATLVNHKIRLKNYYTNKVIFFVM